MNPVSAPRQLQISPEVAQRRQDRLIAGRVRLLRSIHESGLLTLQPDDAYRGTFDAHLLAVARSDGWFIEIINNARTRIDSDTVELTDHVFHLQLVRLNDPTFLLPAVIRSFLPYFLKPVYIALVDSIIDHQLHSFAQRLKIFRHFVVNHEDLPEMASNNLEQLLNPPDFRGMVNKIERHAFSGIGWFTFYGDDDKRSHALKLVFTEQFGSDTQESSVNPSSLF